MISWGHTANALGLFVPIQTIVLITNVKITSFRGTIQGSLGFSSMIDVNPDVLEGALLYDFAQTVRVERKILDGRNVTKTATPQLV
jgi:hypothetical protein